MLEGKTVVITGASSGIGEQLARDFASEGAKVVMMSRNIKKLKQLVRELPKSKAVKCDVSNYSSVKRAFSKIRHIDILINNAGIGTYSSFEKLNLRDAEQEMKTNYLGVIYCTKEALKKMEQGSRIVNVSSIVGKMGIPNMATYSASKHAVTGFTESLHYELHRKGIWTHAVYPAAIKTPFFDTPSYKKYKDDFHPGKMYSVETVSKAILKGIRKNKSEIYVPSYVKWYVKFRHLSLTFTRWIEKLFYMGRV